MATKKRIPVKNKKTKLQENVLSSRVGAQGKKGNFNKMISRILVAVVVLACLWEVFQTIGNQEIPRLKTNLILKIDSSTKGVGPFGAWGASELGRDKIIVADNKNNRLLLFDRRGDFLKTWGTTIVDKHKVVKFNEPSGITADDHGNAYVVDSWNASIEGFNENGDQISRFNLSDKGFYGPRGIGFDGNDFMIADTGSHRIVLIDSKGEVVKTWGSSGVGDGHFNNPIAVTSDKKGKYFVADMGNNRVQILDADGKKIKYIKFKEMVTGVAVDKEGHIYVGTDSNNGEVEIFNSDGNALGTLVDMAGSGDPFRHTKYITVTSDDLLLMAYDDSVCLYQLPSFSQK
jgi:DNA-binding beta-propeller fold protein YncE